jgi:hypothetical protein
MLRRRLAMLASGGVFWLAIGCTVLRQPTALPTSGNLVRDQLVIRSDFPLPRHHRLVDELVAQRGDVVDRLGLPASDEPIYVYLFESSKRFSAFMDKNYPDFPDRRAFFVETDTVLSIYAYWGDRVAEDLRHEVSHGYLHTMVPHLPLWMDEGLAEYFEIPRGQRGLNRPHITLLLGELQERRWSPDVVRLEQIQSAADMTQRDYAESWAWMHLLLETSPERRDLLRNHLARIRMTGSAATLSDTLQAVEPNISVDLVNHLKALKQDP